MILLFLVLEVLQLLADDFPLDQAVLEHGHKVDGGTDFIGYRGSLLAFERNVVFTDQVLKPLEAGLFRIASGPRLKLGHQFQRIAGGVQLGGQFYPGLLPFRGQFRGPCAAGGVDAGKGDAESEIPCLVGPVLEEGGHFFPPSGHDLILRGQESAALADKAARGAVEPPAEGKLEAVLHHFGGVARHVVEPRRVGLARADALERFFRSPLTAAEHGVVLDGVAAGISKKSSWLRDSGETFWAPRAAYSHSASVGRRTKAVFLSSP